MKELWDAADFGHSDLTSQNLREKAGRCMGGVRIVITESVGLRIAKDHAEESLRRERNNICYLDPNNLEVNQQDTDLHTIAEEPSPAGTVIVLSQDKRELIDSSNAILACANTHQGDLEDCDFDTRIKERPSEHDLNNIKTITVIMKQQQVSPRENPFRYL